MASEDARFAKYDGLSAFFLALASMPQANAEPKFSADVPESVKTPDKVETDRLGTLEFFDGMPSPETVEKVYDNLDLTRGVAAFALVGAELADDDDAVNPDRRRRCLGFGFPPRASPLRPFWNRLG